MNRQKFQYGLPVPLLLLAAGNEGPDVLQNAHARRPLRRYTAQ